MSYRRLVPIFVLVPLCGAMLSSCSAFERWFNGRPVHDIERDETLGIIYNKDWNQAYQDNSAYYNNTHGRLNIHKGPGKDYNVIGYVTKNEGGFIRNCNYDLQWCLMEFGGEPPTGWVEVKYFALGAVDYKGID